MDIEMGNGGKDFKRLPDAGHMMDDALIEDLDRIIGSAETADEARDKILAAYSPRPVVTVDEVPDGRSFMVNIRTKITEEAKTFLIDKIAKAA